MRLWDVPDEGSSMGEGYVVMAESADEARRLVLDTRRAEFDAYYDGPIGHADRTGDTARNWKAADWDREMWRRWYYFGVARPWTVADDPDANIGAPEALEGPVYRVPVLGYSW